VHACGTRVGQRLMKSTCVGWSTGLGGGAWICARCGSVRHYWALTLAMQKRCPVYHARRSKPVRLPVQRGQAISARLGCVAYGRQIVLLGSKGCFGLALVRRGNCRASADMRQSTARQKNEDLQKTE